MTLALAALAGCDYSGDWLFGALAPGVDDVYQLFPADGSEHFVPAVIESEADIEANTVYGEVGPAQTTSGGGVTATFLGTGGSVCVFVDPESTAWNGSVSPSPADEARRYDYPDNVYDDGDFDVSVGQSIFYTGSPGVEIGDFEVVFNDELGHPVELSLQECTAVDLFGDPVNGGAGRGTPEYCTLTGTQPGSSYTILLKTFSTPLDDDRLAFGLLIADGTCNNVLNNGGASTDALILEECVIKGEAIAAGAVAEPGPWYGFDAIQDKIWPGFLDFEATFCDGEKNLGPACSNEADAKAEAGTTCEWTSATDPERHCFCGNPNDVPKPGGI
jgi:hypothetical protein